MYNETYEDYIRSILGYPNYGTTTYERNDQDTDIENCYPEIYKIVYPMVNKACSNNTKPITSDLIDELTNEIYFSIENDNEINVTINLTNEIGGSAENRATTGRMTNKSSAVREDRQFRNRGLQDLIRILLIRELLDRQRRPGHRPPFLSPRPPFQAGIPGMRPQFMPRDMDLYEM